MSWESTERVPEVVEREGEDVGRLSLTERCRRGSYAAGDRHSYRRWWGDNASEVGRGVDDDSWETRWQTANRNELQAIGTPGGASLKTCGGREVFGEQVDEEMTLRPPCSVGGRVIHSAVETDRTWRLFGTDGIRAAGGTTGSGLRQQRRECHETTTLADVESSGLGGLGARRSDERQSWEGGWLSCVQHGSAFLWERGERVG